MPGPAGARGSRSPRPAAPPTHPVRTTRTELLREAERREAQRREEKKESHLRRSKRRTDHLSQQYRSRAGTAAEQRWARAGGTHKADLVANPSRSEILDASARFDREARGAERREETVAHIASEYDRFDFSAVDGRATSFAAAFERTYSPTASLGRAAGRGRGAWSAPQSYPSVGEEVDAASTTTAYSSASAAERAAGSRRGAYDAEVVRAMAGALAGAGHAARPLPALVSASSPARPRSQLSSTGNAGGPPYAVRVNRHGSVTIEAGDAARIGVAAEGVAMLGLPAAVPLLSPDGERRGGGRGDAVRRESTRAPAWERVGGGDGGRSDGAGLAHFVLRLVDVEGQPGVRCADGSTMERANVEVRHSPSFPSLFRAHAVATPSLTHHPPPPPHPNGRGLLQIPESFSLLVLAEEVAKILRYDSGFYGTLGCVRAENGVAVITRSTASDSAAEAVPLLGVTFERTNGSVLADLDAPLTAVLGSASRSSPPVLVCAVSKYDD